MNAGNTDAEGPEDASSLRGCRVLVVDDSRTVRRSALGYLESAGAIVSVANDGFDALAHVVETPPDLVIADIVMPRLDGYHLCALIRHNTQFRATPILLLSSRDGLFDRARASAAGATEHLAKPFSRESLIAAASKLLAGRSLVQADGS